IINIGNPNREFDMSNVPLCIPYCIFSVIANYKPKEIEDYIHFGMESVKYNSVTGTPNIKMQMTVLYSSQAIRFQKYLNIAGSNIKLENIYFVSGLFKFSKSGQMIIKATDIDYLKTSNLNYNASENFTLIASGPRLIIDVVADDIESTTTQILFKHTEPSTSIKSNDISASKSSEISVEAVVVVDSSHENKKLSYQPDYIDLDTQNNKKADISDIEDNDEMEDSQSKK
ncbi:26395_t:CDS:1, partial [Racocetra persica]